MYKQSDKRKPNMNPNVIYNSLRKRAALLGYDYTPEQWYKYTTPEERRLISRATQRLAGVGRAPLLLALATGFPFGMSAAAFTPTWTNEDIKEFGDKPMSAWKSALIPGYYGYKDAKVLGWQRKVQQRVDDLVRQEMRGAGSA